MLKVSELRFAYGEEKILDRVSFTVHRGERLCISGPSGRGKTTLLRLILGLEKPDEGKIEKEKGLRIAAVFQEDVLLPWYTALENVAAVGGKEKARALLGSMGLENAADKYPAELSGGMKRRVALCRAFAFGGDLLLLDEGFKGLDDELKFGIMEMIKKDYADKGVIFTSHDKTEIDALATKILFLDQ